MFGKINTCQVFARAVCMVIGDTLVIKKKQNVSNTDRHLLTCSSIYFVTLKLVIGL
jgi:hypothetical protein